MPPEPAPIKSREHDGSPPWVCIAIQHCLLIVPVGTLLMWGSWPYHVYSAVQSTVGTYARAETLARETQLDLSLVIPTFYLVCGCYSEVYTAWVGMCACVCVHHGP